MHTTYDMSMYDALKRESPVDDRWHHVVLIGRGRRTNAIFVDGELVHAAWSYRVYNAILSAVRALFGGVTVDAWVTRDSDYGASEGAQA